MFRSQKLRMLSGEAVWIGVGQCVAMLAMLVGIRLLTTALHPATYGELALALTAATLIQQVSSSAASGAILRFADAAKNEHAGTAFNLACLSLLRSFCVLCTGVVSVGVVLAFLTAQTRFIPLLITVGIFLILAAIVSGLEALQIAQRRRVAVAFNLGMMHWLRYPFAFGCIILLGEDAAAAILGYALALVPVVVIQASQVGLLKLSFPLGESAADVTRWRRTLTRYARSLTTWGGFSWAQSAADRWWLQAFRSMTDVGLYAVLYQIAYYPVSILTTVVTQLISPSIYSAAHDANRAGRVASNGIRLLSLSLVAVPILTVSILTVGRWLVPILVDSRYTVDYVVLGLLVAGGGFVMAGQIGSVSLMALPSPTPLVVIKVGTAVCAIAMSGIGAAWFGVRGVAGAVMSSSLIYCIWIAARLWTLALMPEPARKTLYAQVSS